MPIISTNVGSIAEAVKEKENGFLIEPGDVNSLAYAMIQLTDNSILWKKESRASREICEKKFSENVFKLPCGSMTKFVNEMYSS